MGDNGDNATALIDASRQHERVAVGALIGAASRADAEAAAELRDTLGDGAAFLAADLRRYWRATCAAADAGQGVTAAAVLDHLRDPTAADTDALIACAEACVAPLTDGMYSARAVRDAAVKRDIGDRLHRLAIEADNGVDLVDVLAGVRELAGHVDSIAGAAPDGLVSFAALARAHQYLHPAIIDGLIRAGETANIIAPPKVGKSWLAYMIALSVATGRPLFDVFACTAGRVLLIDNELHPPTIAHRIPRVADALGIAPSEYADRLDVLPLRGLGVSMIDLGRYVDRIKRGHYATIIADAWYRFIPAGLNENANADVMALYNRLDHYAASTGAAWIVVHHASKGGQADKAVTDVGAGAGSQSRAADAHIVLREHEEPGRVVMEAAVRSFPPVVPVGLRWEFPLWLADEAMDTSALKGKRTKGEERQGERDDDGMTAILSALEDGPLSVRQIRAAAGGIGKDRAERLLDKLELQGAVRWSETTNRGGKGRLYQLARPGMQPGT